MTRSSNLKVEEEKFFKVGFVGQGVLSLTKSFILKGKLNVKMI